MDRHVPEPSFIAQYGLRNAIKSRKHPFQRLHKPPIWQHPRLIALNYQTYLKGLVKQWMHHTKALIPFIERLVQEHDNEVRCDGYVENLNELLNKLKLTFDTVTPDDQIEAYALDVGQKVSRWNDAQWQKTLKSVLGVNAYSPDKFLESHIKAFVKENTLLVTKLKEDAYHDVAQVITAGIRRGDRAKTISKELLNGGDLEPGRFRKVSTRATLIARDQVGKLNGELTMNRQITMGVTKYIWRTALDERVRGNPSGEYPKAIPSHWDREGKTYFWSKPPEGGHPGEAIRCRCYAEPVFDEETLAGEVNDNP